MPYMPTGFARCSVGRGISRVPEAPSHRNSAGDWRRSSPRAAYTGGACVHSGGISGGKKVNGREGGGAVGWFWWRPLRWWSSFLLVAVVVGLAAVVRGSCCYPVQRARGSRPASGSGSAERGSPWRPAWGSPASFCWLGEVSGLSLARQRGKKGAGLGGSCRNGRGGRSMSKQGGERRWFRWGLDNLS
ncbi:hypothetical protein NC652_010211 [Populus alba x Populus x berolinensis]|nr:hypothetical protein NC652_010211 [Populus alba x Populus x berolinensis]